MLQQMRRLPKWVGAIVFLPLVGSFALWGIGDIFRGGADTSIATVGGTKIQPQDFSRIFDNIRKRAAQQSGTQLSAAEINSLGKQTLQRVVSDTALDNVASDLGLTTTDDQVSATIRGMGFQGPLGAFDEQTFEQTLQRMNYTPQIFVAEVRRELTRNELIQAATTALVPPPDYVRAIFSLLNEHRAVQYIVLPPDAAGVIPPPPDPILQAYVKAHPDRYSTPEYRELTYAAISPDDVAKQIQVTDAQLHQTYDLRKDVYIVPERRDVQRINFPDEASAKAARAKIDAGTKFEDIAKARGVADTELNLGSLTEADLTDLGPQQGRAAFSLPVDGVSQPLKSTFGWSLIRITKITPGSTKTFDDVKADIKAELVKQLAGSKIEDIVNAFDDARNAGDDLAEAAKKVGMTVVRVATTDEKGLARDGSKASVPASPDFMSQVFKSDIGTEGDPFATSDGVRYVIKVDGVIPSKLKPLDAVRAQATTDWTNEQRRMKLAQLAQELARKASSSAALQAIATQYHASVVASPAMVRGTPAAGFSAGLQEKIFANPPASGVAGGTANGDGFVVAWISGVRQAPVPLGDPRYQQFAQLLGNQMGTDVEAAMGQAARAAQGVTINHEQADRVIGGEGS